MCDVALPPELRPREYKLLRDSWGDTFALPEWAVKWGALVIILGPRIKKHPTMGPWIRSLFIKADPEDEGEPEPEPERPAEPEPEPAPEAKVKAKTKVPARRRQPGDYVTKAADIDSGARAAWGGV